MKKSFKIILIIILITICALFLLARTGIKDEENKKEDSTGTLNRTNYSKEISMGTWNENVYSNDFLGLTYTQKNGWDHLSDEKIAEKMNLGKEILNDTQKRLYEISKLNTVCFMDAYNKNTGSSIGIIAEKTIRDFSEDYYLDSIRNQLAQLEIVKYEIGNKTEENIGKIKCKVLTVYANSYVKQTQKYYVYKNGNYFVCIVATSSQGEDDIIQMISNFQSI